MNDFKYKFVIPAIPSIALILYYFNINNFFLSTDFIFLFYSKFFTIWTNPWFNIRPFVTILFGIQYNIFGFDPAGYHIISIGIHIFNGYLVFFIINELTNDKNSSLIGSLIFITFSTFSEAVFWISAQFDLCATAFIMLSFFSYLKFSKQSKQKWFILSLIFFCFAIFSRDIASVFVLILVCYDVFFDQNLNNYLKESTILSEKIRKIGKYSIKYCFFLIITIVYYICFIFNKRMNQGNSLYLNFANLIDFIPNSFFPLFLDNSNVYMILFIISFFSLVISFYFIFKGQNKILKISLCWILIEVLGFVLFNLTSGEIHFYLTLLTLNSTPQGRFLYPIGVGVAVFYSSIFYSFRKKDYKIRFKLPISKRVIFYLLILFVLLGNSLLIYSQQSNWKRSSQITFNILLKTFATVPIGTEQINIYYINVPDHFNDPFGPSWPTAYIFKNGLEEMIRIFYPNGMIHCYNMIFHKKILDFELPDWRIPISMQDFNQISNSTSNIILYFNPVTELLINVSGLNYTDFDPFPYLGIPKPEYWLN